MRSSKIDAGLTGLRREAPIGIDRPTEAKDLPASGGGGTGGTATAPGTPALYTGTIQRVGGLHKIYFGDGKSFIMGAFNMGQGVDRMFYVRPDAAGGGTSYILSDGMTYDGSLQPVHSQGADWFFINYRNVNATLGFGVQYSYWAISTNMMDRPLTYKRGPDTAGKDVLATTLQVCSSDIWKGRTPNPQDKQLIAARSLCVYQGCVVYGGFRMQNMDPASTAEADIYDHYIVFSDVDKPERLATTAGVISSIRVGDHEEDPVNALAVSSTPTDTQGIKGQLVVFTSKKVTIFDGLPPQTDNPLGVNFASMVSKDMGCNAPRTVVQTPHGVAFLGSDGVVYLVRGLEGVVPIGYPVEPILRGMTPRQQRQCAAYYDPRDRYYKLSFPSINREEKGKKLPAGKLGTPDLSVRDADIPDLQLWADLEEFDGRRINKAIRWFGPMTGMKHSCYVVAAGHQDRNEALAGSAIDGTIFETSVATLFSDPIPENIGVTANMEHVAITGLIDNGSVHREKTVSSVKLGVGTSKQLELSTTIAVLSNDLSGSVVREFTKTVSPTGDVLGGTFTLGTSKLVSGDDYRQVKVQPEDRIRGKMFRLMFYLAPTGSRVFFADLEFDCLIHERRK